MILHRDTHLLIIHIERGKNLGHLPFKEVIGQNIEFLCKISAELIYRLFFLEIGVL